MNQYMRKAKRIAIVKSFFKLVLLLLVLATTASCGTPTLNHEFPSSETGRPLTLSQGLSSWSPILTAARNTIALAESSSAAIFYPFYWEQGLTDKLTLIWFPIPLAARYSLSRDRRQELAIAGNLIGEPYYRGWDFDWSPYAELLTKHRVSEDVAIKTKLLAQADIRKAGDLLSGAVSWEAGPWFQLSYAIAVRPYLEPTLEFGNPRARYLGSLPPEDPHFRHFRMPIGMDVSLTFSSQWNLSTDFRLLRVNYPEGYISAQSLCRLSYWF